jgi:hypothetical protein
VRQGYFSGLFPAQTLHIIYTFLNKSSYFSAIIHSKYKKSSQNGGKKMKRKKRTVKTALRLFVHRSIKSVIPAAILIASVTLYPAFIFAQPLDVSKGEGAASSYGIHYLIAEKEETSVVESTWDDRHPVFIKGKGTLKAGGNGAVRIKGRTDEIEDGIVEISGNGVLLIRDFKGDMDKKITGYGGKVELKKDHWLYYGFNGDAEIKGSGFMINLFGEDLEVYAKGRAAVFLAGEGSYEVERHIRPPEGDTEV